MAGAGMKALTLEAEVVRLADIIAYVCHDLDDAMRARLFAKSGGPREPSAVSSERPRRAAGHLRRRPVATSDLDQVEHVGMSEEVHEALLGLRDFLYRRVYEIPAVRDEFVKSAKAPGDLHGVSLPMGPAVPRAVGSLERDGENQERGGGRLSSPA